MRRSEFREKIVMLLYANELDGQLDDTDYSKELLNRYQEILEKQDEINQVIKDNLVGYTIDRLNLVDKAIIQNAVYEMLFTKLPPEISINEAVNLTKKFSNLDDDSAKRFNNKLLDSISKSINKD
ncbi:MAG: transcription antitermination protein NusB [Tenericutes bacterium]|nr:transcription antitermination protein NusB [Mycoplasmatota bacterium]